jgi:hypothetical protein
LSSVKVKFDLWMEKSLTKLEVFHPLTFLIKQ